MKTSIFCLLICLSTLTILFSQETLPSEPSSKMYSLYVNLGSNTQQHQVSASLEGVIGGNGKSTTRLKFTLGRYLGDEGPSVLNRDPGIKIGTHYGLSVARVMPKFEFGAGLGRASVVNSYGTVLSTGKRRRLEKYKTSPIVHLGFRFTMELIL